MNTFILAGGRSSRMGRDKALLELAGRPLIAHAIGLLRSIGFEPQIAGSRLDLVHFAYSIPDNYPGCGPLGGIEAALTTSSSRLNLFLPVDLPLIPPAFLSWLMERAESTQACATIPYYLARPQPLCAIYSKDLLPGLKAALAAGSYKVMDGIYSAAAQVHQLIDTFEVETVSAALSPGVWPTEPPLHRWFQNINTPADYAMLEQSTSIH